MGAAREAHGGSASGRDQAMGPGVAAAGVEAAAAAAAGGLRACVCGQGCQKFGILVRVKVGVRVARSLGSW